MASLLSAAREEKSAKVMNVSLHVYLIYRRVSAPYITNPPKSSAQVHSAKPDTAKTD
jgi:hypothetical protein